MHLPPLLSTKSRPAATSLLRLGATMAALAALVGAAGGAAAAGPDYPVTEAQRSTARQVASTGVALSELAPDAPDSYTVKRGDTLWDISRVFLRSPWRWPELWGMNLEQIANPHLIYPGEVLVLVKGDGRARLQMGRAGGADGVEGATVKLSPRARASGLGLGPIASVPMHLIQPFLNDAVVLDKNELDGAPRIVAGLDGRSLYGRGDTAYVRGNLIDKRDWRVFRAAKPVIDPDNGDVLGYEAAYVGAAEYIRRGDKRVGPEGVEEIVPATFTLTAMRQEAGVGDRLATAEPRDETPFPPHVPGNPIFGRVASLYGDGLSAGQNQIVALNRGKADGLERGHVLALLRDGDRLVDRDDPQRAMLKLPDERHGYLFVFRVFNRVSYALILSAQTAVRVGDHFVQP
ncbi:MAG: LysM peptidoglycan-binding domain-containing protein [Burkholderiales bacterium]|nr:LysM peptidoglycan-binding domain-containing protein [Burkholderiales bacterium]